MAKCPNCGAEVEAGEKYCGECGTEIPQTKECPQCHAQVPLARKFCGHCRYDFTAESDAGGAQVIGDKNVIAGDVNFSRVSNTTNYINQDETRRVVQCAVCGKSIIITEAFTCGSCLKYVCTEHYDKMHQKCTACYAKQVESKENKFREKLNLFLEDGIIDADEFAQLERLRRELGISSARSKELTEQAKAARLVKTADSPLMMVEKAQCERARQLLFEDGEAQEAVALLESIYQNHPVNESVLEVFLTALQMFDEDRARKIIGELPVDLVVAYLTLVDLELRNGNLTEAERKLASAEKLWPDNNLVKYRRVALMYATAKELDNRAFLAEAMDILTSIPEPTDKVAMSWGFYLQCLISKELGDEVPVLDRSLCQEQGVYFALASGEIAGLGINESTPFDDTDVDDSSSNDSSDTPSLRDAVEDVLARIDWNNLVLSGEDRFHDLWMSFTEWANGKLGYEFSESNAIAIVDCSAVDNGRFGALLDEDGIYVVNMRPPNAQFNGFLSWEDFLREDDVRVAGTEKFCDDVVQICSDPKIGLSVFPRCNKYHFTVEMVQCLFRGLQQALAGV